MDTIGLTFKEPVSIDWVYQVATAYGTWLYDGILDIRMSSKDRISWDFGTDRVYAYVNEENDKVLWVNYTSFDSVRDVISVIADYPDIFISDGFGNEMPGDQYVEILEKNPNRDLRDEYRRRSRGWAELNKKVDATAAREKQEEQEELARLRQEFEEKQRQQNQQDQ